MRSAVRDLRDETGRVVMHGPALKCKYRAAPPEGKTKGRATKGK